MKSIGQIKHFDSINVTVNPGTRNRVKRWYLPWCLNFMEIV
jgi:hypothetical protein